MKANKVRKYLDSTGIIPFGFSGEVLKELTELERLAEIGKTLLVAEKLGFKVINIETGYIFDDFSDMVFEISNEDKATDYQNTMKE